MDFFIFNNRLKVKNNEEKGTFKVLGYDATGTEITLGVYSSQEQINTIMTELKGQKVIIN